MVSDWQIAVQACNSRRFVSSYRRVPTAATLKLSKRGEYALRALIDFGMAQELGRPLLRINELAEKEKLPVKFLEQILMQLRQNGYLDTKRGARGGFFLKRPMSDIRFGEVIRLIDGPLAPIGCVSLTRYERCTCPDEDHCGLRLLMLDVRNAIAAILDRYTLAEIVDVTLRKRRRDQVPSPFVLTEIFGTGDDAEPAGASLPGALRGSPRRVRRKPAGQPLAPAPR